MGQSQLYQSKTGLGPLLYPENRCHHLLLGLLPLFYLIYIQTGSVPFWHICGIQPHELDIVSMRVVGIYCILCRFPSEASLLEELAFSVGRLPDVVCERLW